MKNPSQCKLSMTILLILLTAVSVFDCRKKSSDFESPIIFDPEPADWRDDWLACWSGVHDLIAYLHDQDVDSPDPDTTGIYLIKPDGSDNRLYYKYYRQGPVLGLDWSPDASCLLIFAGAYLIRLSYPDCIADTICGPGLYFYPTFSPDGQEIASVLRGGDVRGIYLLDINGDNYRRITPLGDYPTWLYSDSILYLNYNDELPLYSLCLQDQAGSGKRLLFEPSLLDAIRFQFTKAHIATKRIATVPHIGGTPMKIYVYSDDEGQFRLLTEYGCYPAFSPDGSQIVFTRTEGGDGKLWIINWDGTAVRQLTQ